MINAQRRKECESHKNSPNNYTNKPHQFTHQCLACRNLTLLLKCLLKLPKYNIINEQTYKIVRQFFDETVKWA